MTTLTKKSHAETVRQRRSTPNASKAVSKPTHSTSRRTSGSASNRSGNIFLPVEPQTRRTFRQAQASVHTPAAVRQARSKAATRMAIAPHAGRRDSRQKGYNFAFSLGGTAVHTPTLNLPYLGPRWISAGLTVLLLILLYTMWTANTFKVGAAEVSGNQRLQTAEVESMLGVNGQPIVEVTPAQIASNLRTAFPDLAKVSVQISFPNKIHVEVQERAPILSWYQDGKTTWIDPSGIAFMPRSDVPNLIQITASGDPPKVAADPSKTQYDQVFVSPDTVQAFIILSSQVPEGASMIYDSKYGMGWQDPRGWSVFFGQSAKDIQMKIQVYQAILDNITQQGIQPTLISVEYLDAPFYK